MNKYVITVEFICEDSSINSANECVGLIQNYLDNELFARGVQYLRTEALTLKDWDNEVCDNV